MDYIVSTLDDGGPERVDGALLLIPSLLKGTLPHDL